MQSWWDWSEINVIDLGLDDLECIVSVMIISRDNRLSENIFEGIMVSTLEADQI